MFILLTLVGAVLAEPSGGDLAFRVGLWDEAGAFYEQQYEATSDPAQQRRLLLKLLSVAQARNDLAAVTSIGSRLESALKGQNDPDVAMRLYLIRGGTAVRTLDLRTAAESFARARPLAQELYQKGDPGGALGLAECNSYKYLAPLYLTGRPTALAYGQACATAYQPSIQVHGTPERPLWLGDVARTTFWTRLWIWKAWEFYYLAYRRQDQQLANQWAETSWGIGSVALQSLGQSVQATGDLELAVAFYHVALEMTEGFPLANQTPETLRLVESTLPQWPESSEKQYVQSRLYRSKARLAVAKKDFDRALDHYLSSLEHLRTGKRTVALMDIMVEMAYVHLLDDASGPRWHQEVAKTLERLLILSQEVSYPWGRYFALGFLGTAKARNGELVEAERLLKLALEQLKEWGHNETPRARAQKLARPEVRLFADTLVDVLLRQEKKDEAMDLVGQMGAMSESAGLDLDRVKSKNPETTRNLRSLEESRRQRGKLMVELQSAQVSGDKAAVDRLSSRLADNKADFQKTVNNIRRDDPEFERMVSIRPSSFAKLQKVLAKDVVVAAFYPSAQRTLIFAITSEESHVYSSEVSRKELDDLVGRVRRALLSAQEDSAALNELNDILISPLQPLLKEKKVLAVVPSGKLYYLPFAALKKEGGEPLIQTIGVSLLTATELPDVGSYGARPKPARLLALANPDGSLPGARKEVDSIASLFSEKKVYYGEEATQDRVNGEDDVLHFATHGVIDGLDVNESYLLVSGDDKKLTVGEIYGLDLSEVNLVTLSACQTAVGEFNPGAEIATLSQAFSVAGSKSMLGSLWKVDDKATAYLMARFYTHLTEGKSKAEALRLAQLETAKQPDYSSPYFWSGFILLGDWQ
jgi:CHAT domain-containing protein